MKNRTNKVFTIILAVVFIMSVFSVVPQYAMADEDTRIVYVDWNKADFESLIGTTAPAHDGYLFAGWVNKSTDKVVSEASEIGESDGVAAKFVRADMSRIACQLNYTSEANPETRNMRMVSIVDSTDYKAVGFNVYGRRASDGKEWLMYGHNETKAAETTKVYSSLRKYSSSTEYTTVEPAAVFGSEADGYKFTTVQISNIPEAYFDAIMMARPYWITQDGTYVEGLGEFNRVNDAADKIVNVSVNIKQATDIAAGLLTVGYNSENFEYQNADYGRVFGLMRFSDTGSAVKCVGVFEPAANSDNPNDVFVNLRFKIKTGVTLTKGDSTFNVSGMSFSTIDETLTSVYAPSVKY